MADDDEVGYGKPPRSTRWKRGQSGNPKGRPKVGGTGLVMEVAGILSEPVKAKTAGRRKRQSRRPRGRLSGDLQEGPQGR